MDFSTVKKWIIPEGEVLKVVDSNGDIIWRKSKTNPSWNIHNFGNNLENDSTGISFIIDDVDNVGWKVESNVDWAKLNGSTYIYSAGTQNIDLTISVNTSTSSRSATITFTNTSTDEVIDTYTFTQEGRSKTNPSWDLPSKKYLAPIATNFNINITDSDSAGWELQSDSSWISISLIGQQTYSGTGNSASYIYISENDSDIKRTGYLKLYTGSTLLKTLQIIQGEKTGKLNWGTTIKALIDPSGESFVLPYSSTNAGTISVTHDANGSWFTASNVGNSVFCHASANTTGRIRTVTLTATVTNAQSISMNMTQDSK